MASSFDRKLSIIVPVYNVEQYIAECLNSVMKLRRTGIECIIVNDCTQDGSIGVAKNVINAYSGPIKFKIVEHEVNKGLSEARNTGISESSGEWLFFMDSDDYLIPCDFLDCLDYLEEDSETDIVQTNFQGTKSYKPFPNIFSVSRQDSQKYYLQGFFPPYAWGKFIRHNFIIKNNLFFKKGVMGREDAIWLLEALTKVSSVKYLPKDVLFYRQHPNSIMHNDVYYQRRFDGVNVLFESCLKFVSQCDKDALRYFIMQQLLQFNCELLRKGGNLDTQSIQQFKKNKSDIYKKFHSNIPLKQLFVWLHIFSPLQYLLKSSVYKSKFYTYNYKIRTI